MAVVPGWGGLSSSNDIFKDVATTSFLSTLQQQCDLLGCDNSKIKLLGVFSTNSFIYSMNCLNYLPRRIPNFLQTLLSCCSCVSRASSYTIQAVTLSYGLLPTQSTEQSMLEFDEKKEDL